MMRPPVEECSDLVPGQEQDRLSDNTYHISLWDPSVAEGAGGPRNDAGQRPE
jgi:hypothetical protein